MPRPELLAAHRVPPAGDADRAPLGTRGRDGRLDRRDRVRPDDPMDLGRVELRVDVVDQGCGVRAHGVSPSLLARSSPGFRAARIIVLRRRIRAIRRIKEIGPRQRFRRFRDVAEEIPGQDEDSPAASQDEVTSQGRRR